MNLPVKCPDCGKPGCVSITGKPKTRARAKKHTLESCVCKECIDCCHNNPGWMTPDEATKAIKAGLSNKLMRDWSEPRDAILDQKENVYLLCPASKGCGGKDAPETPNNVYLLSDWSKGTCELLKRNRCTIHNSGFKPAECREALPCRQPDDADDAKTRQLRYDLVVQWNTPKGKNVLKLWEQKLKIKRT